MRMEIDESGRDDRSMSVDDASRCRPGQLSYRHDPAALDCHVAGKPRVAGAVDDVSPSDQDVVLPALRADAQADGDCRRSNDDTDHNSPASFGMHLLIPNP